MRRSRALAAVVLTAGVVGACAAVPVFADGVLADTGTPTTVGLGWYNQTGFNYTDQSFTLQGTLSNAASSPTLTGIPGEPVTITEQVAGTGATKTVAQATTDANGDFTLIMTNQVAGGIFHAVFAGDPANGYAASTSDPLPVEPEQSDVDIAFSTLPKSQMLAGSTVTFAGQVYVPADDVPSGGTNPATPVAGATVWVYTGYPLTASSPHATTAADGTFTVSFKPTVTATWQVQVASPIPMPYSTYMPKAGGWSAKVTVLHQDKTRVEAFTVPATHEIHSAFKAAGVVQALNGTKWQAAASATVAYYVRSLPSGKWSYAGKSKTNAKGAFSWAPELTRLGRLQWQARVEKTVVGTTTLEPSDSAAKNSSFVDRTYVTSFVALHLYGDTSLGAIIQDYPQSGGMHYANVTGTAKFYYLPTGSKTWRYLGASKATSANPGSVSIEPAGTLSGKFKIVFAAQGNFLGSTGTQTLK
ncbi:MAG TPA: hypothetical protein VMI73_26115 [Trebonia sp.]|nr:hypothetical protein [Trebonia sp.]